MEKKHCDVLIEHTEYDNNLIVYADKAMKSKIKDIEGVLQVCWLGIYFGVWFDKRYNADWIEQEIIAQVKINQSL